MGNCKKSKACSKKYCKEGIPSKKEYFAAYWREIPKNKPPVKVTPDLDAPGINAKHWAKPIKNEFLIPIVEWWTLWLVDWSEKYNNIAIIITMAKPNKAFFTSSSY